jgi:alpha-beta hydrolase superfamily lysophospholipase
MSGAARPPWLRPSRAAFVLAGVVIVVIVAIAALGPRLRVEERWIEPELGEDLDAYLRDAESGVPDLRPGAERAIVWLDPEKRAPTALSIVYLHGFSADRHELEPVVSDLGRELGANVYFARLRGHGRDGAAMAEATVEDWFADAAEAVAIGARIGERVVLMGTSTGGSLAAWAATRKEARSRLSSLVLVSPNFRPRDRTARVLLFPWGGLIARLIVGPERCFVPENDGQARHWTTCYPTSALVTMMALVEYVRTMDLSGIEVPTLVLYSPDDVVVDATETERVLGTLLGTEPRSYVVEDSSDPSRHVLAGDILSPTSNDELLRTIMAFLAGSAPEP